MTATARGEPVAGSRYQLKLPTTLASSHALRALRDEVQKFVTYHAYEQIEGKDPIAAGGMVTVAVVSTGHIVEPIRRFVFGMEVETKPLKRPVPGVMVHLARWATPYIIVEVPIEQVVQLGLSPEHRYFVRGSIWPDYLIHDRGDDWVDEKTDEGKVQDGKVIEEKDFVIPVAWLDDISDENIHSPWLQQRLDADLKKLLEGESG